VLTKKTVNFSGVVEMDDNVEFGQTAACAGGYVK
jgi:hypothetical protein